GPAPRSLPTRHVHRCGPVYVGRTEAAVVEVHGGTQTSIGRTKRRTPVELLAAPLRRLQGVSRVGLVPLYITRWSVDRRDVLTGQPEPRLHLGPMVAGVQDTPPEALRRCCPVFDSGLQR